MDRLKRCLLAVCLGTSLVLSGAAAFATETVTDVGVNADGYITASATKLGTSAGVILGVLFAFMLVWKVVAYFRRVK